MPQPTSARWWLYLAVLAAFNPQQSAAEAPSECPAITQPMPPFAAIPTDESAASLPTRARADRMETTDDDTVLLYGNVELQRDDQRISADQLIYNKATTQLQAQGNVRLENLDGDQYQTPELYLRLDESIGYSGPGNYRLGRNNARGSSERISFEGKNRVRLTKLHYTTCPESQEDWSLTLGDLQLDKSRNLGTARHAVLRFKRMPIFYWPYLRFPISEDRQTGFLMPELGRSDKLGTEFAWPFYWNIAPNYDATFAPQILSKRGLNARGEFRYLARQLDGQLNLAFLPDDDETGKDRYAGNYSHLQTLGPRWTANLAIEKVSDNNYLDDFGNELEITSLTHLKREADLRYGGKIWDFRARALGFQTIDETIATADRPYDQLPQLALSARPLIRAGRLNPVFESELVNFQRDDSLTGRRLNLRAGFTLPFRNAYGFITPTLSAKHIGYDLDLLTAGDDRPDVTVGIFSLDSGLIFERDMRLRKGRYIQTLEPRLFYLRVPFEPQDGLPDFDTDLPDLTFANLFRENRFVGGDRVGDANQATLALTTRVIGADDGIERLGFSIGQIFFFDDREVNLPPSIGTANTSDVVLEFSGRFANRWYARNTFRWNPDRRETNTTEQYIHPIPTRERQDLQHPPPFWQRRVRGGGYFDPVAAEAALDSSGQHQLFAARRAQSRILCWL